MERFHAGIAVPTPLETAEAVKPQGTPDARGQDAASEGGTDFRCANASGKFLMQRYNRR